jgi:DNA invertase Pin-like site-specific DNA recombinase
MTDGGKPIEKEWKKDMPATRRAAMYVRMSTDHQKYSTENQADAIREYATHRNIEIIETFADEGKSGLKMEGRDALKRLIETVQTGKFAFNVILVLDVTRWGRFQDADESAYYEYICRRAGIDVQYVAEQFENDGSPVSTIVKGVKRAMAGEYSRELSGKVFAGQCRLIEKGFKQGGTSGYGLRRALLSEDGVQKAILKVGEHKSFQTDRVIYVPGPPDEVEIVNWMYRAFVDEGMREAEIMALLNQRGILTDLGRPWTRSTVHQVLTNEKYIGNNVFNRVSFKLKKRRVVNAPDMWVRCDGAFEAVVDKRYFYEAQRVIHQRNRKMSDEDMLEKLRSLHVREGWLSGLVIDEAEDMPSSSDYRYRFGSLVRAYSLIGYIPDRDLRFIEINRQLRQYHARVIAEVSQKIVELKGFVRPDPDTDLLCVNGELQVSIVIARCQKLPNGKFSWMARLDTGLRPDLTIIIRMDQTNEQPFDYYLLPGLDVETPQLRLKEQNSLALDSFRFDDLEGFFVLTKRTAIPEAA